MMLPSQEVFESTAREAFDFLIGQYGYQVAVDQTEGSIVFLNDSVAVKVFREPRSFMVYVELLFRQVNQSYLLHEVLHVLAPQDEAQSQCSGASEEKLTSCMTQLGDLCQRHLRQVFANDPAMLEMIAQSAAEVRKRYTLEAQYGAIKDRANLAWDRKEWERARELYRQAKPALSVGEQRRLDFLETKRGT